MTFNIFKKELKTLTDEQQKVLNEKLGYCGRMISASKRTPQTDGRDHLAVFNGNVYVEGYGKIWYGDIDVTRDETKLTFLALELKSTLYILREMDCRFDTQDKPNLGNALYVTDGDTEVFSDKYERVDGKLLRRI